MPSFVSRDVEFEGFRFDPKASHGFRIHSSHAWEPHHVPYPLKWSSFGFPKTEPQLKKNSGDIPNSMRCPREHRGTLRTLVEPGWNPRGTSPQGRPVPPRSLSGLRPQSFQLVGKKHLNTRMVSICSGNLWVNCTTFPRRPADLWRLWPLLSFGSMCFGSAEANELGMACNGGFSCWCPFKTTRKDTPK